MVDVDETSNHEQQVEPSTLLDLVLCALREHVLMEEGEYLAVALVGDAYVHFRPIRSDPPTGPRQPGARLWQDHAARLLAGVCRHGRKFDGVSAAALFA